MLELEKREKEFEPLDSLIAKQLPGLMTAEVEAKRQEVRDKYHVIQAQIADANTVDGLKEALAS